MTHRRSNSTICHSEVGRGLTPDPKGVSPIKDWMYPGYRLYNRLRGLIRRWQAREGLSFRQLQDRHRTSVVIKRYLDAKHQFKTERSAECNRLSRILGGRSELPQAQPAKQDNPVKESKGELFALVSVPVDCVTKSAFELVQKNALLKDEHIRELEGKILALQEHNLKLEQGSFCDNHKKTILQLQAEVKAGNLKSRALNTEVKDLTNKVKNLTQSKIDDRASLAKEKQRASSAVSSANEIRKKLLKLQNESSSLTVETKSLLVEIENLHEQVAERNSQLLDLKELSRSQTQGLMLQIEAEQKKIFCDTPITNASDIQTHLDGIKFHEDRVIKYLEKVKPIEVQRILLPFKYLIGGLYSIQ